MYRINETSYLVHKKNNKEKKSEAEFLDVIVTKVWRVFLIAPQTPKTRELRLRLEPQQNCTFLNSVSGTQQQQVIKERVGKRLGVLDFVGNFYTCSSCAFCCHCQCCTFHLTPIPMTKMTKNVLWALYRNTLFHQVSFRIYIYIYLKVLYRT